MFFCSYLNNTDFVILIIFSLYPRLNINHSDFHKFPFDYKYSKEIIFSFNYYYCMTRSAGSRWRRELRNVSSIPRDWKPRACVLLAFCLVFTTTLLVQVTHWRLPARAEDWTALCVCGGGLGIPASHIGNGTSSSWTRDGSWWCFCCLFVVVIIFCFCLLQFLFVLFLSPLLLFQVSLVTLS